jgi:hypothetical protein
LSQEIKVMEAALLAPRVPQEIRYYRSKGKPGASRKDERVELAPSNDQFTDIQAALFRYPAGEYLLLAVNSRPFPVTARITVENATGVIEPRFGAEPQMAMDREYHDRLEPFGARALAFRLPEDIGRVDIDVRMRAHPPETRVTERVHRTRNEQQNPSFEKATITGWPDYYKHDCRYEIGLIGDPGALWGIDDTVAKFGARSLRMTQPHERALARVYWNYDPQNDVSVPYTLSCWIKGDRDGIRVTLRNYGVAGRECTVTRDWARYHLTFDMPVRSAFRYGLVFDVLTWDRGTIWMDGIQLEKGSEPTAFEP